MRDQEPDPKTDDRIRQGPVARWEDEGGAIATGHEPSAVKAFCTHAMAITRKLLGSRKLKKSSSHASVTKHP